MDKETMVYYDITAWERVDTENYEELKDRCQKICSMLNGLGIMKFVLRTEDEVIEQQPEVEQNVQPDTN